MEVLGGGSTGRECDGVHTRTCFYILRSFPLTPPRLLYSHPCQIFKRDFTAPTLEDKIDKSVLPKAMQVRRDKFGKVGQTKYTHLADQDTTDR